jgi:hypothetical protein
VRPYRFLIAAGLGLAAIGTLLGGWAAGLGGAVALVAQLAAVAVLRPAMTAPQAVFMGRWLSGMGIRALALGAVIAVSATHQAALPLLPAALGYLGVLLPLLFAETRFLR